MTLKNLLAIHRLQVFDVTPGGLQRLLASADRNLADARLPELSAENRFDTAYKAIIQCAMIGLWANGYRTSTSQPGTDMVRMACQAHRVSARKNRK